MNKSEVLNHWKYFLTLEKDVNSLKNFIEITPKNYNTFSFELSKLLQLACSEIDSVCRLLCKQIDDKTDFFDKSIYSGNIVKYKKTILSSYPKLVEAEIHIPGIPSNLIPWKDWNSKDSPEWWASYNKVKHYRHSCFEEANLINTLSAIAALMVIILCLYRIISGEAKANPNPLPNFFDSEYCSPTILAAPEKELPDFT